MKFKHLAFLCILSLFAFSCQQATEKQAQKDMASVERSDIEEKYKWNLDDLFATKADWESAKNEVAERIPALGNYKGKLGKSAKVLKEALDLYFEIDKDLYRVNIYAYMLSDNDTRKTEPAGMVADVSKIYNDRSTITSFIEPEILSISDSKIKAFIAKEPGLKVYKNYLNDIKRMAPHTLSPEKEALIAEAGIMVGSPNQANNVLQNAELPWKVIQLSSGQEVKINESGYGGYRYSSNRDDRIKVFDAFYGSLSEFKLTKAALLNGKIKENIFYKNVRNYDNVLQSYLFPRDVPEEVYLNLIKNVKSNLEPLHRYLTIRKEMLGVNELHYYDFYPQLVKDVSSEYTIEKGQELLAGALSILGEEYSALLQESYENRWIDVYPNAGKAAGAYCDCAYGTHPYVHINFNNKFDDVSMMAHELGHAMHSYLSNKNQPYPTSDYASFVAEVAAITNESLLMETAIKNMENPQEKLAVLCNYAESMRQTIFRQTLFAEYEYEINKRTEEGQNLSADDFDAIYLEMLREYYGHDKGVSVIDDNMAHEWGYISHFYIGFYNYMYATSYLASIAVADKIMEEGEPMVEKYLAFLSAGGTKAPLELLNDLGVDMTSSEPFELAVKKYNWILDEIDKLR